MLQGSVTSDPASGIFGPDAEVSVFGSRVDDAARGGDIDLLVQVVHEPLADGGRKVPKLVARPQLRLGDRPIDVLVLDPATVRGPLHVEAPRIASIYDECGQPFPGGSAFQRSALTRTREENQGY